MDKLGGGLERLRTRLLEKNRWSWRTWRSPEQLPFTPEIGKCLHHIHRPETSCGVPASSQVSSASEDLRTKRGGRFRLEPLRECGSDQTTQHIAAAPRRKTRISGDDREDRMPGRSNDRWYTLEEDSSSRSLGSGGCRGPRVQLSYRRQVGEKGTKFSRMRCQYYALLRCECVQFGGRTGECDQCVRIKDG